MPLPAALSQTFASNTLRGNCPGGFLPPYLWGRSQWHPEQLDWCLIGTMHRHVSCFWSA